MYISLRCLYLQAFVSDVNHFLVINCTTPPLPQSFFSSVVHTMTVHHYGDWSIKSVVWKSWLLDFSRIYWEVLLYVWRMQQIGLLSSTDFCMSLLKF